MGPTSTSLGDSPPQEKRSPRLTRSLLCIRPGDPHCPLPCSRTCEQVQEGGWQLWAPSPIWHRPVSLGGFTVVSDSCKQLSKAVSRQAEGAADLGDAGWRQTPPAGSKEALRAPEPSSAASSSCGAPCSRCWPQLAARCVLPGHAAHCTSTLIKGHRAEEQGLAQCSCIKEIFKSPR